MGVLVSELLPQEQEGLPWGSVKELPRLQPLPTEMEHLDPVA